MHKPTTAHWTYEDYLAMPDDGKRYEIIDGELLLTPAPIPRHQRVGFELAVAIHAYLKRHPLGLIYTAPCDVVLADDTVVQPDIIVFLEEHRSRVKRTALFGPPDLAIEVLSPSTARRDRVQKLRAYGRYGVREYWIVDPAAETIEIFLLEGTELVKKAEHDGGTVRSLVVLPAFSAQCSEIFAEP